MFDEDEVTCPANAITVEHNLVRQVSRKTLEKRSDRNKSQGSSEDDWIQEC